MSRRDRFILCFAGTVAVLVTVIVIVHLLLTVIVRSLGAVE